MKSNFHLDGLIEAMKLVFLSNLGMRHP